MSRQEVDIGVVGNDGTGDSIREAFRKVNDNFKEIYAIFNQGDTISLQDLGNVPNTLGANRILTTDASGVGIKDRILFAGTGIEIDAASDPNKITVINTGRTLSSDTKPKLVGPLNANNFAIGNVKINNDAVAEFNSLHGTSITLNDLVINKQYADANYIRKTGGSSSISGQIRVRDEPTNANAYVLPISGSSLNNVTVTNHGFDSGFDGASYVYVVDSGIPSNGMAGVISVTDSTYFLVGRSYKIESLGNTNFTTLGALRNKVGEVFTLTNVSVPGYGSSTNVEGGSPSQLPTNTIDGGTPSTTVFTTTYSGGSAAPTTLASTGTVRPVYFLRYVNANNLSVHPTFVDAQNGTQRINFNFNPGVQKFIDAYYDIALDGNWLSNEVLPRKSVVRRQGDKMEGVLMLADHPFPLEGAGTPNRPDDLQAASKYYVDNSSFASRVNLFVSTTGSDTQTETPQGKEGRAWAYAYRSVSKACEVAEHMMNNAVLEPGPYRQLIMYSTVIPGVGKQSENSIVTSYTPPGLTGLGRLKFTNRSGSAVDQSSEIIAGKIVKGRQSGATGIVYEYATDNASTYGEDYVDLQQVRGEFLLGENIEYADPVTNLHITIHVESGIYDEDYPIRIPDNTAIVGDEFRRVLIRPRDRISQSPWAYTWFFRNSYFDGLNIATGDPSDFVAELDGFYGYHYLRDSSKLVNRGLVYTNAGGYTTEATAIKNNKNAIQIGIKNYTNSLGSNLNAFDEAKLIRDVGYILDAIIHDLEQGGIRKIFDIQESFYQVTWTSQYRQGINYIDNYINTNIIASSSSTVKTLISNMITKIDFVFSNDYNTPKNNKDIDVFLCNDSSIVRQVTCQGHGGFMMVLDPNGQILSKSPYCQQSGSFSASINQKSFRGGQYIDGFSGNLTASVVQKISTTQLKVTNIPREPKMPSSFFINGERYKVDSWIPESGADLNARDLLLANRLFISVQTLTYLADTYKNIKYPEADFERHIARIIDAITFDVTAGGNSKTLNANRRLFHASNEVFIYNDTLKPIVIDFVDKIKEISAAVIVNQTVTPNQQAVQQVKITGRSGAVASQTKIVNLLNDVKDTLQNGLDAANALVNPTLVLVLDASTPLTSNPTKVTLITPGNTSMLSNDFTQVNDLGYGIVTNNNGLSECVSVFSYYCHTGMYSSNGGQIRSLNSSTANGEYGLVASGSDPLEVPDQVELVNDTVQVARIVKRNTGLNNLLTSGNVKDLFVYVDNYQYLPYNVSILELNHGSTIGIKRYEINNITVIEPGIIRLNFNTSGNNSSETGGLAANVLNGDKVIIRGGQNFKFTNVIDTNPTRPSTALTFEGDPANDSTAPVYRVISYNIKNPDNTSLPANQSILTFDSTYNYISLTVDQTKITTSDTTNPGQTYGNTAGDTKIAVKQISVFEKLRLQTGQMIFAWDGRLHRIVDYVENTGVSLYHIVISDRDNSNVLLPNLNSPVTSGLQSTLSSTSDLYLRAGLSKGELANITVRISTMRATGHDFLDVGTGGYNTSNYPSKIYGAPSDPNQAREVEERNRGRVFYVSTDQDGFFRVGRFFTVDQGTGTVTFAASIALSNLDGIGFKRGVSVSEFSSDDKFIDLANDVVPTEAAISGYIDRRLGIDRNGLYLDPAELFPNAPGFIARNASSALKGPVSNISWAGYKLTDLGLPTNINDAANKDYVDTKVAGYSNLKQLRDVYTIDSEPGQILMFTSETGEAVAAGITGDLAASITSGITTTLTAGIGPTGGITAIEVADASLFPDQGYVLIDDEIFYYNGRTTGSGAEQLDGVIRLSISTNDAHKFTALDPAAHNSGATVYSLNSAEIELQIKPEVIVNADISPTAGIVQSKLSLNLATSANTAPTGTTAAKQAASGLASFDDDNFEVTDGWVKVKDGGIARVEQENVTANRLLGNLTNTNSSPLEISPESVLKRATWDAISGSSTIQRDHVFTFRPSTTEAASIFSSTEINTNVTSNSIPRRTATGNLKITNLDSNGNVSIISISGTVILGGVTYIGNGVFSCNATTLVVGGRIFINGTNAGSLVLPNYNASGTNYFIIDTNGSTEFTLSSSLGGQPIVTTGSTISGLSFINATGTEDNATPVTYKGQWSPGNAATLRATSADTWTTARTITVTGDAVGTMTLNGGSDQTLTLSVGYATTAGNAGSTTNDIEFNNSGLGDASGIKFNGISAKTISYNTIGACKFDGTGATGTWGINITGNAATATTATSATTAGSAGSATIAGSTTTVTTGGSVTTTLITSGAVATAGTITGTWTLTAGSKLQSTYSDLAEYYTSDKNYEPGTVLVFGGNAETTTTTVFGDSRVAGIVTTDPAYVMNTGLKDKNNVVCLALQGRVPCKVIGKISKGDLLTTSAISGYAIKAINPTIGTIIGKALQNKDDGEMGVIEVAVGRC